MPVSQDVLSLINDENSQWRWNVEAEMGTSVVVTYSFPETLADYYYEDIPGFQAFSERHQIWVKQALDTWSAAGGVSFVEVPADVGGQITFSMRDMTGLVNSVGNQLSGYAYYPRAQYNYDATGLLQTESAFHDIGGDVFMNAAYYAASDSTIFPGIRGYSILLHEIGHALGLKHPFGGGPVITPGHDNGIFTIMSYNRPHSTTTLGVIDKEAITYLYGDTDLRGSWDSTFKAVVHNGSGAGETIVGTILNDIIYGNDGADRLIGKDGNDRLFDGAGDDTVDAGSGRDFVFAGRAGNDVYDGGSGRDHISYSASFGGVWLDLKSGTGRKSAAEGDSLTGFENGTGSDGGNDRIWGTNGANQLRGLDGDDRLFGRAGKDLLIGGDGADRLDGGRGADRLKGGQGADVFVFGRKSGDDTVVDFEQGTDQLKFARGAKFTAEKAMSLAVQETDAVVFEFLNGDRLRILNVSLETIGDDIA